jgi:hypothetical protein
MSRSGYTDDCENLELWRGAVTRAITGKRGQALLRDLLAALDAMPEKTLAADSLVTADGDYCTLGVLGKARGMDLAALDPEDPDQVANAFGIARAMAQEIVYLNDEQDDDYEYVYFEVCGPLQWWKERHVSRRVQVADGPARRWKRMRAWVASQIKPRPSKESGNG